MPRSHHEPIVFQIGFNRCGTKYLTSIFAINGYTAKHWEGGALAEDIAYSKAANIEPLTAWPDAVFFSDMESVHKTHRPPMLGYKEFEYLHRWFPDAVFILNKRKSSEWVASRFSHHGGEYRGFWSHHLKVDQARLPEIWQADWEDHFARVLAYFKNNERFLVYDIDSNRPGVLTEFLGQWFKLENIPEPPNRITSGIRESQIFKISNIQAPSILKTYDIDHSFVDSVSKHCVGEIELKDIFVNRRFLSDIYGRWDGKKSITDKNDLELPIKLGDDGFFHSKPGLSKLDRTESVVNEIISLNLRGHVQLDMQDARWFGQPNGNKLDRPLLVYNRRPDTKNMVLWPLPGYHTLGRDHYVHSEPIDQLSFDEKLDRAVWRGNLSGQPNHVLAPNLTRRRAAHSILDDLATAVDEDELLSIQEELMGMTRYNLVSRFYMSRDIDAALTIKHKIRALKKSPLLSMFWANEVELGWFFKSRYILSLSGYDTGSNFLMAANSNSVVMKESDGWDLFYTNEFRPWEHFIPLELGALDVKEKLDWARSNPRSCKDMIQASQQVCSKFASRINRTEILRNVFSASFQD